MKERLQNYPIMSGMVHKTVTEYILNSVVFLFARSHSWSSKPSCREDVVTWFREVESKRGAGLSRSPGKVSKWFHGEWLG